MPILLYRVDERLIHGQVTVGWGSRLRPTVYLVVDDRLAESAWEQELYRMGLSDGAVAHFLPVDRARDLLPRWAEEAETSVLLTRDVATMARLAEGGTLAGRSVNLGGIHSAEGRTEVLPYLFLSPQDRELLTGLVREGVVVEARDLPGSRSVDLAHLLD